MHAASLRIVCCAWGNSERLLGLQQSGTSVFFGQAGKRREIHSRYMCSPLPRSRSSGVREGSHALDLMSRMTNLLDLNLLCKFTCSYRQNSSVVHSLFENHISLTLCRHSNMCWRFHCAGVPASQSKKGGGGFKWWYGLLIGLGSAAVLCLLAAGAFILLRHQRRRSRSRQSSIGQSLPSSKENDHQYTVGSHPLFISETPHRNLLNTKTSWLLHPASIASVTLKKNNSWMCCKIHAQALYVDNIYCRTVLLSLVAET